MTCGSPSTLPRPVMTQETPAAVGEHIEAHMAVGNTSLPAVLAAQTAAGLGTGSKGSSRRAEAAGRAGTPQAGLANPGLTSSEGWAAVREGAESEHQTARGQVGRLQLDPEGEDPRRCPEALVQQLRRAQSAH